MTAVIVVLGVTFFAGISVGLALADFLNWLGRRKAEKQIAKIKKEVERSLVLREIPNSRVDETGVHWTIH